MEIEDHFCIEYNLKRSNYVYLLFHAQIIRETSLKNETKSSVIFLFRINSEHKEHAIEYCYFNKYIYLKSCNILRTLLFVIKRKSYLKFSNYSFLKAIHKVISPCNWVWSSVYKLSASIQYFFLTYSFCLRCIQVKDVLLK